MSQMKIKKGESAEKEGEWQKNAGEMF